MLTLEQAKNLQPGDILVDNMSGQRWKCNGKVQTWKRDPNRIRVPMKHGLYRYGQLTETYFVDGECPLFTLEPK